MSKPLDEIYSTAAAECPYSKMQDQYRQRWISGFHIGYRDREREKSEATTVKDHPMWSEGYAAGYAKAGFAPTVRFSKNLEANVTSVSDDDTVWTSDGQPVDLSRWCECRAQHDVLADDGEPDPFYWEHDHHVRSYHGWGCGKCRRVCQTG